MKPNYWKRYRIIYGEKSMLFKFHKWLNKINKKKNKSVHNQIKNDK